MHCIQFSKEMFWPLFSITALEQQFDLCAEANNLCAVILVLQNATLKRSVLM